MAYGDGVYGAGTYGSTAGGDTPFPSTTLAGTATLDAALTSVPATVFPTVSFDGTAALDATLTLQPPTAFPATTFAGTADLSVAFDVEAIFPATVFTGTSSISQTFTGNPMPVQTLAGAASMTAILKVDKVGPAVSFGGSGQLAVVDPERIIVPELKLWVHDPTLIQAPTSVTVSLVDGKPNTAVTFEITDEAGRRIRVYDGVSTDGDGQLQPTSIPVPESVGSVGEHTIYAHQAGSRTGSGTFTIKRKPALKPRVIGVDAEPVPIAGADWTSVRKWILQDLMPGGLGSYVLPVNPSTMSQPHFERVLSAKRATATNGQFHIIEGGSAPVEWSFEGYCPTQEMHDKLLQFRDLNRRFYLIDHRKRAWKVTFVGVDIRARLQQMGMDGVYTDWGHDYTVEVLVYDQEPVMVP